jgi:hypothetical protein
MLPGKGIDCFADFEVVFAERIISEDVGADRDVSIRIAWGSSEGGAMTTVGCAGRSLSRMAARPNPPARSSHTQSHQRATEERGHRVLVGARNGR